MLNDCVLQDLEHNEGKQSRLKKHINVIPNMSRSRSTLGRDEKSNFYHQCLLNSAQNTGSHK
jgi:hypothetical protein